MKNLVILLLFCVLTLPIVGCVASVIPFAGSAVSAAAFLYVTWKNGEATKYYHYNTTTVHRAVRLALNDMDIRIASDSAQTTKNKGRKGVFSRHRKPESSSDNGFQIMAGNSNRFKIRVEHVEKDICRLKVRIDFWGDKPYVELLYKKVDEYLNVVTYGPDGKPKSNH